MNNRVHFMTYMLVAVHSFTVYLKHHLSSLEIVILEEYVAYVEAVQVEGSLNQ